MIVQRLIDVDRGMIRGATQAEVDHEIGQQWNFRVLVICDAVLENPDLAIMAVRCARVRVRTVLLQSICADVGLAPQRLRTYRNFNAMTAFLLGLQRASRDDIIPQNLLELVQLDGNYEKLRILMNEPSPYGMTIPWAPPLTRQRVLLRARSATDQCNHRAPSVAEPMVVDPSRQRASSTEAVAVNLCGQSGWDKDDSEDEGRSETPFIAALFSGRCG